MGFNYSDFESGAIKGFQFARPNCGRNEYRQGILNAAKARLFEQDVNKDGVLTFDEYVNANEYANQRSDSLNNRGPVEASGNYQEYLNAQAMKRQIYAEDFNSLDVNGDGVLDKTELANEINLMDRLDGNEDGTVTQKGRKSLWNPQRSSEAIAEGLCDNYEDFNAENLGKPWDLYGKEYSKYMGNLFKQDSLYPQVFLPYQTHMYNQVQNINGLLDNTQSIFNNLIDMIKYMFMQNSY